MDEINNEHVPPPSHFPRTTGVCFAIDVAVRHCVPTLRKTPAVGGVGGIGGVGPGGVGVGPIGSHCDSVRCETSIVALHASRAADMAAKRAASTRERS